MNISDKTEIARGFIDSGKYRKAIDYLTGILSENDSEHSAWILRGYAYFCTAEIDKAIADLTHAIEINHKADLAFWYLSEIFLQKTEYEKAREYIIRAIELDSENINYIGDYAVIEQNLNNFSKSIELCTRILSAYPADHFALTTRGYGYLRLNDFNKAIADFERALIEDPLDAMNLNNLGFALIKNGEVKKVFKYLQLSIGIEPSFSYPYDNLGYLYYLDQDYGLALKNINTAIELDPSNSWAFKNRALVFTATGVTDKAIKDLYTAKELGYAEDYDDEVNDLIEKAELAGKTWCQVKSKK